MGQCILRFDRIQIQNQKSDNDHADNDWLSIAWCVDHRDGKPPDTYQQTVALVKPGGSAVLKTGDVVAPIEQSVPAQDTDIVTAVYTITNWGSSDWGQQAQAASQVTQHLARNVADVYLQIAQTVCDYMPFLAADPTGAGAIIVGDAVARALDYLHGPLLDLVDTMFEKVITPLIGDIANELADLLGHPNCNGEVMHDVALFLPTTEEYKKNSYSSTSKGPQQNASCGEPPHTQIDLTTDRNLDVFVGTFGKTTVTVEHPLWLYAVKSNGDMMWYRQDAASSNWDGPRRIGNGWESFQHVLPAGGSSIYGITPDGVLKWYRHDGFNDGSPVWQGPVDVGSGWQNFLRVFSGSDGVLYAVQPDGTLLWYRNFAYGSGGASWSGPLTVGSGWAAFRFVFSMGEGIVYAVQPDGTLLWYHHTGFATGEATWSGPKTVGSAWNMFRAVVPVGLGVIVAVRPDGSLLWYRHTNYLSGTSPDMAKKKAVSMVSAHWEGPVPIGSGWQGFLSLIALLPAAAVAPA